MNSNEVYENSIKQARKTSIRLKKRSIFLISLILLISILFGFFMVYRYYNYLNSVTFEDYELYQYFSGAKVTYNGKATIRHDSEISSIEIDDKKVETGDIPIYFQNIDNECILPENMELVFPSIRTKSYKVNYFSKINYDYTDGVESAFLIYKDKKNYLDSSFLYNGDNLYFFPYSVSIVIDGSTYNLSSLSYIIVNYKDMIEIYDRKSDKYTIIDSHNDDVIATLGDYKINLSTDMILYENENRLLIKNIDKLSNYSK